MKGVKMIPLIHVSLKGRRIRLHGLTVMGLASLIWLIGTGWNSIIKLESIPVGLNNSITQNLRTAELSTDQVATGSKDERQASIASTATFAPFLDIVPSQDGAELFIRAGGVGEVGGTVFANIGVGPGNNKGGHTMTFSNTLQTYIVTVPGFTPNVSTFAPINITTTTGLDTGTVDFNRAYVPASTTQTLSSIDGLLQLSLVNTDTITYDTYIAVVPSFAPPSPPPPGHRLVGSAYSVRAAGATVVIDRPMNLRLSYDNSTLAGADPHTLAIFAWGANPDHPHWDNLGGALFPTQQYMSVATSRFTTYALMATSTWHDDFDTFSGLSLASNVTLGGTPGNRTLILASTPGSGSAVSQSITPATTFIGWAKLTFTGVVSPPTTNLTLDVLSVTGSPVLTNVSSGVSLANLDSTQYPALRLRVNLASTAAGQTPALAEWQLSWQVEEHKIYLPVVLK